MNFPTGAQLRCSVEGASHPSGTIRINRAFLRGHCRDSKRHFHAKSNSRQAAQAGRCGQWARCTECHPSGKPERTTAATSSGGSDRAVTTQEHGTVTLGTKPHTFCRYYDYYHYEVYGGHSSVDKRTLLLEIAKINIVKLGTSSSK